MTAQMTVQSGVRTRCMGTLVQRVRGEGLAVDELLTFRNDDMVIGGGVVGLVSLDLVDGAEEEVLVDHQVNGRMALEVTLLLDLTGSLGLELLVHIRSGHLEVRLGRDVEHVVDLELRIDLVFGLLLLGEVPVVVVGYALLRLRIHDGEGREEDREGLFALVDGHHGKFVPLLVTGLEDVAVLVFDVVQVRDAVEGSPDRDVVAHLLGLEHQHQGIAAVVMASGQVLGRLCRARSEPGLLPVTLQRLDLVDHQLREAEQGLVGRRQVVVVLSLVLCHGRYFLFSSSRP